MATTLPVTDPDRWECPDHNPDVAASSKRLETAGWAVWELIVEIRNLHLSGTTATPRKLRRRLATLKQNYADELEILEAARAHGRAVVTENRNRKAAAVCVAEQV